MLGDKYVKHDKDGTTDVARPLVAAPRPPDLLLRAKDLFVAANGGANRPAGAQKP
jgi:hypothetical protein